MTPALRLKEIEDYCMRAETVSCIKALWLIARVKQLERKLEDIIEVERALRVGPRSELECDCQEALTTMPEGQS